MDSVIDASQITMFWELDESIVFKNGIQTLVDIQVLLQSLYSDSWCESPFEQVVVLSQDFGRGA